MDALPDAAPADDVPDDQSDYDIDQDYLDIDPELLAKVLTPDAAPIDDDDVPEEQMQYDFDEDYFDIDLELLAEDLEPSPPPSPPASVHEESDEELDPGEIADDSPSPFLAHTRRRATILEGLEEEEVESKLLKVLDTLDATGMDIPLFLETVCWGRQSAVRNARIRSARTTLMVSDQLPVIIKRCLKPPRWNSSTRKKRATGGRKQLLPVITEACLEAMRAEMVALGPLLTTNIETDVRAASLTGFTFPEMHTQMTETAPVLVCMLDGLSARNPSPLITVTTIAQLMYRHNRAFNRIQKTYSVYFKFKGLSAKGFDVLHGLGLVMSHAWINVAIGRMSKMTLDELRELIKKYPWTLTYDNVVIFFKVFAQRLDNQQKLTNGTAATAYIKKSAKPLSAAANADLKARRAASLESPLGRKDVWDLFFKEHGRVQAHYRWTILAILLECPEFDISTYAFKDSVLLQPPPPLHALPTGKDSRSKQFLLGSVNQAEASYADHEQLILEWLRQLDLGGKSSVQDIGLKKIIAFLGDQLTVSRLRGLFARRRGDDNSFDRLDFLIPIFGWFHFAMQVANSLHAQYAGRAKGTGLLACFTLLGRKGLTKTSTEGPFHSHLNEALHHIAEAHFRELWRTVGHVSESSLKELRNKSPEQLISLADTILSDYASSAALEKMKLKSEDNRDRVQIVHTQFARDVLPYIQLVSAIKSGDVGMLEALLPTFLFRFIGGGNHNYQEEVLELLNGLHKEWPPEVADHVRNNCWLVTFTGRPNSWVSFDQAQEHNIKDIKVTYKSPGPRGGWEYMHKLHPAIPTIRMNADFVDQVFNTLSRGKKHTIPKKEGDIQKLMGRLKGVHGYERGRTGEAEDVPDDYLAKGGQTWMSGATWANWKEKRTFVRSTEERYHDSSKGDISDESDVEITS
ncbi:hypothetical protein C8F01DRAFT_1197046 [Mycena amicta]|nr:hypothetical protein C8F01DRAFT_1197046 [Mycena amicta]